MSNPIFWIVVAIVILKAGVAAILAVLANRLARWIPSEAWKQKRIGAIIIGIAQIVSVVWIFMGPNRPSIPGGIFHFLELVGFCWLWSFLRRLTIDMRKFRER